MGNFYYAISDHLLGTQAVWVLYTMPTLLEKFGLRVVIYSNDHRPAHVHVQGKGREAVSNLHCPDGPPELRENYGFSRKELGKIFAVLTVDLARLCAGWWTMHGKF
jgi:hypothetical protein